MAAPELALIELALKPSPTHCTPTGVGAHGSSRELPPGHQDGRRIDNRCLDLGTDANG